MGIALGPLPGPGGPAAEAAVAAPPERLAEELTDHVGVLTDPAPLTAAQDRMVEEKGLQLFVVVVDDFDGMTPDAWLQQTATLSQLGDQDLAAAFAADTRELTLRVPEGAGLARAQVAGIEQKARSAMASGDVEEAVRAVVHGLDGATQRDARADLTRNLWWGLGAAVLLAVLGTVLWTVRTRARRRAEDAEHLAAAARLAREHGTLAVELDDALEAAALEVDFAAAEFDPPLVASMSETVSGARDQSLEGHRRRGAVVTGPVDEPRWLVAPATAHRELDEVLDLSRTALRRVRAIPALLAELRRESDLVPTRIAGLRELAGDPRVTPGIRDQVAQHLARAEADVAAGRPESALVPLQTVVALLGPVVSGGAADDADQA